MFTLTHLRLNGHMERQRDVFETPPGRKQGARPTAGQSDGGPCGWLEFGSSEWGCVEVRVEAPLSPVSEGGEIGIDGFRRLLVPT